MLNAFLNIFIPIIAGYSLRHLPGLKGEFHPIATRFLVSVVSPVVIALSFWGLDFKDPRLIFLPIIGLIVAGLSFFPAWLIGRWLKLAPAQMGIFLTAAMFANVGFYGGYIAFERFGQYGYNLVALYLVYFSPLYYTVGFIIAEHYSGLGRDPDWFKKLHQLFRQDIVYRTLLGILIGFALATWGPERPSLVKQLVNYLIPFMTWAFLFLTGFVLYFRRMRPYLGAALWLSVVKFIFPLVLSLILIPVFNLMGADFGVVRRVVVLEALCPVAVAVVTLTTLFKLDADLASTIWLVTHLVGFFLILPFFYLLA